MDIKTTLEKYQTLKDYFAPEYERDNEVLNEFKDENSSLTSHHTNFLVNLLENSNEIADKYFVADILYLYDNFDEKLIEPLIKTAINHKDPSFNRVFIRPCINAFGHTLIADNLIAKYKTGNDLEGIKRLLYWIRPEEKNDSVDQLRILVSA